MENWYLVFELLISPSSWILIASVGRIVVVVVNVVVVVGVIVSARVIVVVVAVS